MGSADFWLGLAVGLGFMLLVFACFVCVWLFQNQARYRSFTMSGDRTPEPASQPPNGRGRRTMYDAPLPGTITAEEQMRRKAEHLKRRILPKGGSSTAPPQPNE